MLKTVRVPEKFAPLFELAQTYVSRYFASMTAAPDRGTLEIQGQRYLLVRAASISVDFHAMVEKLHGDPEEAFLIANGLLFDIAHAMGLADAKAFAERMGVDDPIARLSAGPVHFAHAGWALVDISAESDPSPDENYYLLYDHPNSFESEAWLAAERRATHPVCSMSAGYSSGWCEHAFGLPLVAVEILCRARGDEACRFVMACPERVEDRIADYAVRHPELAERIRGHRVPGFFTQRTDTELARRNLELEQRYELRAQELTVVNQRLQLDILERKRAEAELNASKELNERLIEALPGGVVQVAKDGQVVSANAEAMRILGLDYDTLQQRYVKDFETRVVYEDGSPVSIEEYPVTRALQTGQTQPATTLGVKMPDGVISWGVYRAVAVRDPQTHEITGAVVTIYDISERKHVEEKLRHTQKLESLGVLAGGIAHDFNNLLVTILGNASFARSIAAGDAHLSPLLEEIELGARRATELTKQMLDYAGQGSTKLQTVDLPLLVREMSKLLTALIPKQVELHHHFQEGLPSIEGDATQLRQVVMNLITNAAESIVDTRGRVVISIERVDVTERELDQYLSHASGAGSFLKLAVTDDGCGMNEETLRRVFDPFFTTKFKGRGLGMAAVLGIVRRHGGAIRIESHVGVGTEVCVLIPATSATATPRRADGELGTILIVEDDAGVQAVARRVLTAKGYRVLTASDGVDGVRMFRQHAHEIRLILMDQTMPRMSGVEALRAIRALGSKVPVLLSSGYVAGLEAAEFAGFLEKPYDHVGLLAAVEAALSSRK
jgi:PAS domain S-box-containing protein